MMMTNVSERKRNWIIKIAFCFTVFILAMFYAGDKSEVRGANPIKWIQTYDGITYEYTFSEYMNDKERVKLSNCIVKSNPYNNGDRRLRKLKIPSYIEYDGQTYYVNGIGYRAFIGERNLEEVTDGGNLQEIGEEAFSGCTGLKSVEFLNNERVSLTILGNKAFDSCSNLKIETNNKDGSWNPNIRSFGDCSFKDCESLDVNLILNNVTNIGIKAFYNAKINSLYIESKKIAEIGSEAFRECPLTRVSLMRAEGLKKVGDKAFEGCNNLLEVSLPVSLNDIGSNAFENVNENVKYRCYKYSYAKEKLIKTYRDKGETNSVGYNEYAVYEDKTVDKNIVYILSSDTGKHEAILYKVLNGNGANVDIPRTVKHCDVVYDVKYIYKNAFNSDWCDVSKVTIHSNIVNIAKEAFNNSSVNEFVIHNTVNNQDIDNLKNNYKENENENDLFIHYKIIEDVSQNTSNKGNNNSKQSNNTNVNNNSKQSNNTNVNNNTTQKNSTKQENKDTECPTIECSIDKQNEWSENKKVNWTVTDTVGLDRLTVSDRNDKVLQEVVFNGKEKSSGSYTITGNGYYLFTVYDKAGNHSGYYYNVRNIDNKGPTITIAGTKYGEMTSYAMVNASITDDSGVVEYYLADKEGKELSQKYKANGKSSINKEFYIGNNGIYYIVAKDKVGNETKREVVMQVLKPSIDSINKRSDKKINIKENIPYFKNGDKLIVELKFKKEVSKIDVNKVKIYNVNAKNESTTIDRDNNLKIEIDNENLKEKKCDVVITFGDKGNGMKKIVFEDGFLVNSYGNTSAKIENIGGTSISTMFYIDNKAPEITYELTKEGKVKFKVDDDSLIKTIHWKKLNTSEIPVVYKDIQTYNKECYSREFIVQKGSIVVEATDLVGNRSTKRLRSDITANVSFVKKENNTKTYRITTNFIASINQDKNKTIENPKYTVKPVYKDTTAILEKGKNFLVDIEFKNEDTENTKIELPQGLIYVDDTNSSKEPKIVIGVDNTKPEIELISKALSAKKDKCTLKFKVKDETNGTRKYQIIKNGKLETIKKTNKDEFEVTSTMNQNGKFKLKVWDAQNNKSEFECDVTEIDQEILKISDINYSLNDQGKVVVKITANKPITADGWSQFENNSKCITKEFEESDLTGTRITKTVSVVDNVSNRKILKLSDKIAPRLDGEIKKTVLDNGNTKIEAKFTEKLKITKSLQDGGWTLSEDGLSVSKETNENQELTVEDLAGNELEEIIKIEINNETNVEKLVGKINRIPTNRSIPYKFAKRTIHLNRAIEKIEVDDILQGYIDAGKLQCNLLDDKKTVVLEFSDNTDSNGKITFVENVENEDGTITEKREALNILKVYNIVKKGDINFDNDVNIKDVDMFFGLACKDKIGNDEVMSYVQENNVNIDWNKNGLIDEEDLAYVRYAMDVNEDDIINLDDLWALFIKVYENKGV